MRPCLLHIEVGLSEQQHQLPCCLPVQGNFNKLKMLQKLLNDTPADGISGIGWLWWIDIDTVVDPAQVRLCSPGHWQLWHYCKQHMTDMHRNASEEHLH